MYFLDFYQYYAAGLILSRGGNVYDPSLFARTLLEVGWPATKAMIPFPYPPWSLYLFLPLGYCSWDTALAVWSCASVLALLIIVVVLARSSLYKASFNMPWKLLTLAIISFIPLQKALFFGQITPFIFFFVVLAHWAYGRGARTASGIVYSFALVKYQLFPALTITWMIYSWVHQDRRWSVGILLGFLVQIGLSSWAAAASGLAIGEYYQFMTANQAADTLAKQGALLPHLLFFLPRVFAEWCALISAVVVGYVLGRRPFSLQPNHFFSLAVGSTLLTAPFLWSHDLVLLAPAFVMLAGALLHQAGERLTFWLLVGHALIWLALLQLRQEALTSYFLLLYAGLFWFWRSRFFQSSLQRLAFPF